MIKNCNKNKIKKKGGMTWLLKQKEEAHIIISGEPQKTTTKNMKKQQKLRKNLLKYEGKREIYIYTRQ